MFVRVMLVCLLLPVVALAQAPSQNEDVRYAAPPAWVVPMQSSEPSSSRKDAPFYFTYSDVQVLSDGEGTEEYQAYRVKLLQREALSLGNINLAWMPAAGGVTVHHLRILRDGQAINVLDDTKFAVFQPQNGIEYSILSGRKLANVQVPGLRLGDEIEFAYTIRSREIALPDYSYGLTQVGHIPAPGPYRVRIAWTDGKQPVWRLSDDIATQMKQQGNSIEVRLDDPPILQFPEDAPPRYAFKRMIEFSDIRSWRQLSSAFAPMFSEAAKMPADSRIKELATRIKTENAEPIRRARAALQLVQDEVRYVYVEMNGGNLIPAAAEKTWQRRYGDCKAKTVLLMALLSEMGIPARPVLVSSEGGDGLNEHLPNPQFFDHVMVQAEIDGALYWLDGTRTGDLRMRTAPPDFYKWVLPVTAEGMDITAVPFIPLGVPQEITVTDVDARSGYDKPAKIAFQRILRGNAALILREALASLPASETETQLKQLFRADGVEVESATWKFDVDTATLVMSVTRAEKIDWEKLSDTDTRTLTSVIGAGFYPPPQRKRIDAQDAAAPWWNDPSSFSCNVTTMHLPAADPGWIWSHNSMAMDRVIGGVAYWRMADLTDGTMRMVMAKRTLRDEISSDEAEGANNLIPDFDNLQTQVYQMKGPGGWSELEVADDSIKAVPTAKGHDWERDASPCIAPRLRK